jgi:hypothetical protein
MLTHNFCVFTPVPQLIKMSFRNAKRLRSRYIREGNTAGLRNLAAVQAQIDDAMYALQRPKKMMLVSGSPPANVVPQPDDMGQGRYRYRRRSYRGRRRFRGRGGFFGDVYNRARAYGLNYARQNASRFGGYAGALAGGLLGPEGAALGSTLGSMAGQQISNKLLGNGAYETTNQLINPTGPSSTFSTAGDETNDVIITHTEFLDDITSSGEAKFTSKKEIYLNPGLSESFPWLSQIAQYFDEYEWCQLVFHFKSMVTEGNSTAGGTIIHCTQYNPNTPFFTTKQQMENYEYASSHKVTDHGLHGVECDPLKKGGNPTEYVRTGKLNDDEDLKTYDLATYQLAIANTPATSNNLGELWVTYTVKLKKTKVAVPGSVANNQGGFFRQSFASPTTTNMFVGTTSDKVTNLAVDPTFGTNEVTLPKYIVNGRYMCNILVTAGAADMGVSYSGSPSITNGTIVKSQTTTQDVAASASKQIQIFYFSFDITAAATKQCKITLPALTFSSTAASLSFNLIQLSPLDTGSS